MLVGDDGETAILKNQPRVYLGDFFAFAFERPDIIIQFFDFFVPGFFRHKFALLSFLTN